MKADTTTLSEAFQTHYRGAQGRNALPQPSSTAPANEAAR